MYTLIGDSQFDFCLNGGNDESRCLALSSKKQDDIVGKYFTIIQNQQQ